MLVAHKPKRKREPNGNILNHTLPYNMYFDFGTPVSSAQRDKAGTSSSSYLKSCNSKILRSNVKPNQRRIRKYKNRNKECISPEDCNRSSVDQSAAGEREDESVGGSESLDLDLAGYNDWLEFDIIKPRLPETKLWYTVLVLAIQDIARGDRGAISWVTAMGTDVSGFQWVCDMLDLRAHELRSKICKGIPNSALKRGLSKSWAPTKRHRDGGQ